MKKGLFILLFCVYAIAGYGQKFLTKAGFDSIINLSQNSNDDKVKLHNLFKVWEIFERGGKMDTSLYYVKQAYDLAVKLNNQNEVANACLSLGNTYYDLGEYPQALDSYMEALRAGQQAGSKYYIANATCNLGLVYFADNEIDTALEYYTKALKMDQEQHDSTNITAAATDIGTVYYQRKQYPEALVYFRMCLDIDSRRHYANGIGPDLDNIGSIFMEQQQYDSALVYFNKCIEVAKSTDDVLGVITGEMNLGEVYLRTKKYDESYKLLTHAYALADTVHSLDDLRNSSLLLSDLYAGKGEWEKAYREYQIYSSNRDSLIGETRAKEIGRVEAKSGYEKQLVLNKAESKRQKIVSVFSVIISLAVAIIAIIIFRSLKVTRKQKMLIEEQKKEVEEKNKEVFDSITYAKRLQDAILPPINQIKKYLPESFILYKPKDIVAGDFYFFSPAEHGVVIAACDCTGHGVPGAMVSVVCSNALNRTVKEFGITEPGKILDKTRELVLETFEKSDGGIKDGMDVSLLYINLQALSVSWSGAYNSLSYIQHNELKEIDGDKQPIGICDNPKPFTTHTVNVNKGDTLYLFTDGYVDQFGGPKGKKFKHRQLSEMLKAVSLKSMNEQEQVLNKQFEEWKGIMEQTDDICMIGIKI